MSRRPIDAARLALKVATGRSVRCAGGLDAVAEITRVGRKTLHDYSNTGNERHRDTFMPVDVLSDLIDDAKDRGDVPALLVTLCELAGGSFVRACEPDRTSSVRDLERGALGKRLFELAGLIGQNLAGDLDDADLVDRSSALLSRVQSDLAQLKQEFLRVKGGDS